MNRIGFFQEKDGSYSMMRLVTFQLVTAGIVVMLAGTAGALFGKSGGYEVLSYGLSLVGAGITGKTVQKFGEREKVKPGPANG